MTVEILSEPAAPAVPRRDTLLAMRRGFGCACPACGQGRIYASFLKVRDACSSCGEELHHHRADDAPPYFTIFVVGHVIVAGVMAVEKAYAPELWVHALIWLPLIVGLSLLLLPRIKGALIGLQWAQRMHGFGDDDEEAALASAAAAHDPATR